MKAPIALKRVGQNIFIKYYESWNKNKYDLVELLMMDKVSNEAGARIRIGYAKQIIKNQKLLKECLDYTANHAKKVDESIKLKAKRLLTALK